MTSLEQTTSLPVIDLSPLALPHLPPGTFSTLSQSLCHAFSTTGFAYLSNPPLSFQHDDIFRLAKVFFSLPAESKFSIAKQSHRRDNQNTYRGYFPAQDIGRSKGSGSYKEGLEIGPPGSVRPPSLSIPHYLAQSQGRHTGRKENSRDDQNSGVALSSKIDLTEPNVWPAAFPAEERQRLELLYTELQELSRRLLALLAVGLGEGEDAFEYMIQDSISTLRLLHYPPLPQSIIADITTEAMTVKPKGAAPNDGQSIQSGQDEKRERGVANEEDENVMDRELICAPHTDSGILTLLHQDATGGLEVFLPHMVDNDHCGAGETNGEWIPAPYIPNTIVVNIGDLMSHISGGKFKATLHRVRSQTTSSTSLSSSSDPPFANSPGISSSAGLPAVFVCQAEKDDYSDETNKTREPDPSQAKGRFSVPFFFEPGVDCVIRTVGVGKRLSEQQKELQPLAEEEPKDRETLINESKPEKLCTGQESNISKAEVNKESFPLYENNNQTDRNGDPQEVLLYGHHVVEKMKGFVEFWDVAALDDKSPTTTTVEVVGD